MNLWAAHTLATGFLQHSITPLTGSNALELHDKERNKKPTIIGPHISRGLYKCLSTFLSEVFFMLTISR